jgi:hypothetical protein
MDVAGKAYPRPKPERQQEYSSEYSRYCPHEL